MTAESPIPTNVEDALSFLLGIPAIAEVFEEKDRPYLINLLALNTGKLKDGSVGFKVFAVAATYLRSIPDLHFLEVHDGTRLGDIQPMIESFEAQQTAIDEEHFLPTATPGKVKYAPFISLSIPGRATI